MNVQIGEGEWISFSGIALMEKDGWQAIVNGIMMSKLLENCGVLNPSPITTTDSMCSHILPFPIGLDISDCAITDEAITYILKGIESHPNNLSFDSESIYCCFALGSLNLKNNNLSILGIESLG